MPRTLAIHLLAVQRRARAALGLIVQERALAAQKLAWGLAGERRWAFGLAALRSAWGLAVRERASGLVALLRERAPASA